MDTGSADFWVASKKCDESCAGLDLFSCSQSNTYKRGDEGDENSDCDSDDGDDENEKDGFSLEYGTGSIYMKNAKDNVQIGGLVAKDVSFGEAVNMSETFVKNKLDGIMGFGFNALSRGGMTPVYEELYNQKVIKEPFFTFCQNRDSDSKTIHELYLGGTNPEYYKGPKARADITKPEYWTFKLTQIKVGKETACANGCDAIADSGTTDIRGPKNFVEELNSKLGASRKNDSDIDYTISCDLSKAPIVSFMIGDQPFSFTPDDYVYTDNDGSCKTIFGISRSDKTDFWILGQLFLKGICTEFHFKEKYLIFAPIKDNLMA